MQLIAVTATADAPTRADIVQSSFRPSRASSSAPSTGRTSISRCGRKGDVAQTDRAMIARHKGESGIVYCASRKGVEKLSQTLRARGVAALPYHAGLEPEIRSAHQDEFLREDGVVIVATIAFGMGIDKQNVRFVCHADLPQSIEAYYQEIGRAGRDGLPADALTLLWRRRHHAARAPDRGGRRAAGAKADGAAQAQRAARPLRDAALPAPDPARRFRRKLEALRQLRYLRRQMAALQRRRRGAEGRCRRSTAPRAGSSLAISPIC